MQVLTGLLEQHGYAVLFIVFRAYRFTWTWRVSDGLCGCSRVSR